MPTCYSQEEDVQEGPIHLFHVFQTRNINSHFVDGVCRSFCLDQHFLGSHFLWSYLFFQKLCLLGLWDTPWWRPPYRFASSCSKNESRNLIFSSLFLCLSAFLVLALAAKHRSHVSIKSGSSRDNWYPIFDAIVVIFKVCSDQSLIKLTSYSQWKTYIGSFLHSCKFGRLISQYH